MEYIILTAMNAAQAMGGTITELGRNFAPIYLVYAVVAVLLLRILWGAAFRSR